MKYSEFTVCSLYITQTIKKYRMKFSNMKIKTYIKKNKCNIYVSSIIRHSAKYGVNTNKYAYKVTPYFSNNKIRKRGFFDQIEYAI
jgi:hypothetical protein